MDVEIKDLPALRRVSPTMLRSYLEAHNWTQQELWRDRIVIWANTTGERAFEILMPLREYSDTYALRISESVALLSEIENRSQLEVYYDLMGEGADVIRLKPLNGVGQEGWNLGESVEFLTRARDLLAAAARAAERPGQPVYRGRPSSEVADYVRSVRPLPGYETGPELTLHSQVQSGYGVQRDMGDPVKAPFPRRATIALNDGLREASRTVDRVLAGEEIEEALEEATSQGASANLYDAVAALARGGHGISVSLAWAGVRPASSTDANFAFSESSAAVFSEGAELLRQNSPFLNAHVTGEIVRLDRVLKEEFDGQSIVLYELDGRPIPLHVQFQVADHEGVVRAFREGIQISVNGDIHREGRTYQLRNPHGFAVAIRTI